MICPRGHSFDISRSGYINLLQPQEKRARIPGDNPDAVAARRRFLDGGHAEPLLHLIRDLASGESILDVGCGEGYYLGSMKGKNRCGIDISTAAIDLAARRYRQCEWIVANADRFIPYADRAFATVMSITGRMNGSELRRVLKSDGRMIVAVSAPDDLIELRGRANRDRRARTIEMLSDDFEWVEQRRATARLDLDDAAVRDLLAATYRPGKGKAQRVTLSLDVLLFTPRRSP